VNAALITAPGVIEITAVDDPTPGPLDVIVEVAAVGLCGTDLHILAGEHGRLPVTPGHEVSGTIVAVGEEAGGITVGDRVAVDPSLPCGACRWCRRGRQNLCVSLGALGVTAPGGAAASSCIVLPNEVDLYGAAMIEPLSCAVRGYDVLRSQLGASVLVYGAGTRGLLMVELAKRTGAVSVHVVEVNDERRAKAVELGCSGAAGSVAELEGVSEWDVVIDATGNAGAIQDGLRRLSRGGTYLQVGVSSPETRALISPYEIYNRELTITGSRAVLHSFERAADLFSAGVIDWRVFVTDQVPLDEIGDALTSFAGGQGIKTQVLPNGWPERDREETCRPGSRP
jgi:2-desacetyl-2-hydroxyethyl bacteriochlorophyllide A dehydrogenase